MSSRYHIQRHTIDAEWAEDRFVRDRRLLGKFAAALGERPDMLEGVAKAAGHCFGMASVVAPERSIEYAALASRAHAAIFAFASGASASASIRIDSEQITVAPFEPQRTDVHVWRKAFGLALIARDQDALAVLSATDIRLLRQSCAQTDGYHYIFAAMLQSWHRGRDIGDHYIDLERATVPAEVEIAPPMVVERTMTVAAALMALVQGQGDAFNRSLAASIESHQAWWSSADLARDSDGFVATESLGLACAAADQGMEITVESGYLPRALIERDIPA